MESSLQLVLFTLDDRRIALKLFSVERVIRAVVIAPLPGAPSIVLGVINVEGTVVPVVDMRSRFGLSARPPDIDDQYILVRTSTRILAVVADEVKGAIEADMENVVKGDTVLPGLDYVEGILKLKGKIALIHDLDRFLSLEEEKALDSALVHGGHLGDEK